MVSKITVNKTAIKNFRLKETLCQAFFQVKSV